MQDDLMKGNAEMERGQRRGRSGRHEDEGVTSFFFSNFPIGVGEVEMFRCSKNGLT